MHHGIQFHANIRCRSRTKLQGSTLAAADVATSNYGGIASAPLVLKPCSLYTTVKLALPPMWVMVSEGWVTIKCGKATLTATELELKAGTQCHL